MPPEEQISPPVLGAISASEFRRKYRWLIFNAWNVPAIFGLSFILYVKILSVSEMTAVMTNPLEPVFIVTWIAFSLWYFTRFARPIIAYLESPEDISMKKAVECVRRFPLHFWSLFLVYLMMAPVSVIWAAELYAGFEPQPVDWFRISMVALIVSIIVGLPIFFIILDLFGRALTGVQLQKPHITVKTKVFLIGALVPLLIDTMLVQYYWTRTGFFTAETFIVWLFLEFLAIGGSLIFVRSFGQSLAPMESVVQGQKNFLDPGLEDLRSQSTDEIGVMTSAYRNLLNSLKVQSEILELNNQLLRKTGNTVSLKTVAESVVSMADRAIEGDTSFLILHDGESNELVGVAQTGAEYNADGYFRIKMDEPSLAIMAFEQDKTFAIADVQTDPRCSPRLRQRFKIRSAIATPLRLEGRPIGVLMCTSTHIRRDYTARDEAVFQGLGREAALAMHTQLLNEQKLQAETAQREKDELINLLMNSTEEAIYGVDLNGTCTFVNRACVQMLGYEFESELVGQSIHELIHHTRPDGSHYPKSECVVRLATLEGSSAHRDDEFHWRKNGSSFPTEYWSRPIRKNGEIVGTVVTFIDITERTQAENNLRESEKNLRESKERLDKVVNSASIVLFVIDRDGVFILSEGHGLQALGLKPGQVVGSSVWDVYGDVPEILEDIKRALKGEEFVSESTVGDIIFQVNYSPMRDDHGAVMGTMGVAVNVTERKRVENELRDHREHLEELVEDRTTELQAVNKELEAFSYSVSHDLRAPLRSIDGFSLALLEDYRERLEGDAQDYLKRIRGGAQKMSVLIDDLLDLSRVTRSEMKEERVDLSALVAEALEELATTYPERNVETLVAKNVSVYGDKRLLKVLMDNLLGNAWKYTGKTENARIEFGKMEVDGETVFYVKDNGAGFNMKYADKLFGAFQRLHTTDEFPGTGVGLATAQRIVHRHGGRIWAEAEPDNGASFYFCLSTNTGG